MKCKRCRNQVSEEADVCPYCQQDLTSLRQLLKNFYKEEAAATEGQEAPPAKIDEGVAAEKEESLRFGDRLRLVPTAEEKNSSTAKLIPEKFSVEEGEVKTSTWVRALRGGFWLRFMALAIDQVIVFLAFASFVILGLVAVELVPSEIPNLPLLVLVGAILPALIPLACILTVTYFSFFHGAFGQTIGKMIFGLRVVRSDGQPLSFSRALIRTVACILSAFPLGLGFFWVGFTASKRSWHDHIADTIVVKEQW